MYCKLWWYSVCACSVVNVKHHDVMFVTDTTVWPDTSHKVSSGSTFRRGASCRAIVVHVDIYLQLRDRWQFVVDPALGQPRYVVEAGTRNVLHASCLTVPQGVTPALECSSRGPTVGPLGEGRPPHCSKKGLWANNSQHCIATTHTHWKWLQMAAASFTAFPSHIRMGLVEKLTLSSYSNDLLLNQQQCQDI